MSHLSCDKQINASSLVQISSSQIPRRNGASTIEHSRTWSQEHRRRSETGRSLSEEIATNPASQVYRGIADLHSIDSFAHATTYDTPPQ
ncbi:unnamed protein product [Zymoseptoria tritici ST99CH_1A5]|uniref:Uncharacterized protein n=3 Tax=Zymoseptoria tritici TaxID=1047171 RepID=A0A1X7RKW9_ZYMT9|nr:unnamed protein product [Zymoseptoria tritici ST99CH_3D7]SMR46606.1 unnamed protein product [Zymoseptoria tritici ST99CH_1E4]SMY21755.1 unnamed protein product [Zymoseptoria tritici ST99CH_1A5]